MLTGDIHPATDEKEGLIHIVTSEMPNTWKMSQKLTKAAKSSQKQPGAARIANTGKSSQKQSKLAQNGQKQEGLAKCGPNKKPKVVKSGQSGPKIYQKRPQKGSQSSGLKWPKINDLHTVIAHSRWRKFWLLRLSVFLCFRISANP